MFALLASLCLICAPVPRCPQPSPLDEIRPGFRWYYSTWVLQATHVDGERVRFRVIGSDYSFGGMDGYQTPNTQSRQRTWDEAIRFGVPKFK